MGLDEDFIMAIFADIRAKVGIAFHTDMGTKIRIVIYTAIGAMVIKYTSIWAKVIIHKS